jgi:hypothetical protein
MSRILSPELVEQLQRECQQLIDPYGGIEAVKELYAEGLIDVGVKNGTLELSLTEKGVQVSKRLPPRSE